MEWYKTLDINQKINLKTYCDYLVGLTWTDMKILFNFRERIEIIHNKLKIEGFDV